MTESGNDRKAARWTAFSWRSLLLLLALAPIPFGANRPWAWSALALIVALLLSGWAAAVALGRKSLVWRPALLFPLVVAMGLLAWVGISIIPLEHQANPVWQLASDAMGRPLPGSIALSVDSALTGMMRLMAYAAVFWLAVQYCRDHRRAEALLVSTSWVGLAIAAYGLVNFFAGNPYLLWYERWAGPFDVTGTFVNRNHYATYAGLGIVCSAALGIARFRSAWQLSDRSQQPFPRMIESLSGRPIIYFLIMLVIGMAWLQAHSRMGAAAVLIGMGSMLLLLVMTGLIHGRIFPWLIAVLVLVFLFLVSGGATLDRIGTTGEFDRWPLFSIVSEQIASAPYTGSGYGSFAQAFPIYRDLRLPVGTIFQQAHSSYLELAAELGIPATVMLVLAVAWCAGLCLVGAFRRRRGQVYPIVAVAATVVVGLHALVDFSLQIPAVAALYAALLGMGVAQSWSTDKG